MFESEQDTVLLYNSLISAFTSLKCDKDANFYNSENFKNVVSVVSTTVHKIIVLNLRGFKEESKIINELLRINRRLHAAVFYCALKSCGIRSVAADEFYMSLNHTFPPIDWNFYLQLNFHSFWSEYFIECAQQLPCSAIEIISKKTLNVQRGSDVQYYLQHMILDLIVHKYFLLERKVDLKFQWPFNFNYSHSAAGQLESKNSIHENENHSDFSICNFNENSEKDYDSVLLENILEFIYKFLDEESKQETQNPNFVIVLLHFSKTLYNLLNKMDLKNIAYILPKFNKFLILLKDCIASKSCQELLAPSSLINLSPLYNHLYVNASWGVNVTFLTFLVFHYWKRFIERFNNFTASNDDLICRDIDTETGEHINQSLKNLNPILRDDFALSNDIEYHLSLLINAVNNNYPCAVEAVKIFLSHSSLLERNKVFSALEEKLTVTHDAEAVYLLVDVIIKVESEDIRLRLLKILFRILEEIQTETYNKILIYVLTTYGCTDKLKLPDFETDLDQFLRQVLTLVEAERILPCLFLQSPRQVLKCVVKQSLTQGFDGKTLIQALKVIPVVCNYETAEGNVFICEINNIFEDDGFWSTVKKNLGIFVKHIIQVQGEKQIFPIDLIFSKFIVPNLHHDQEEKFKLILCSLNEILAALNKTNIRLRIDTLELLVYELCKIIDRSIETGNGNLKEIASTCLLYLNEYQNKSETMDDLAKRSLSAKLSQFNSSVSLYALSFLPHNLDAANLSVNDLFLWSCITKTTDEFQKKMEEAAPTYVSFLTLLTKLVPHFTKSEWLYSYNLIAIYCQFAFDANELSSQGISWKFPKNTSKHYPVLRIFLETLYFLIKDNAEYIFHIVFCFSNSLLNFVKQEKTIEPQFLLNVFLDLCFLVSDVQMQVLELFRSLFIDLTKLIFSNVDENLKDIYQKMLLYGLKNLPASSETNSLLSIMK